jgi:hypothetical protein
MATHRKHTSTVDDESSVAPQQPPHSAASPRRNDCDPQFERKREAIIQSIIGSQALEGVHLSYDEVARLVDEARDEPFADIG